MSSITTLLFLFFYLKTKSWMNTGWMYLLFPIKDIRWKEETNVCLFRFWARGQQCKIKHIETVAFIHFGAKLILILYDSFVFLGVFFLYFPPLTSFLLSSLETPTQNQFFAILILIAWAPLGIFQGLMLLGRYIPRFQDLMFPKWFSDKDSAHPMQET